MVKKYFYSFLYNNFLRHCNIHKSTKLYIITNAEHNLQYQIIKLNVAEWSHSITNEKADLLRHMFTRKIFFKQKCEFYF